MKAVKFTESRDGFCGRFAPAPGEQKAVIMVMNDDGPEDLLSRAGLKWLNGAGVSAMAVGPAKSRKGLHSWPLEQVEDAVLFLKAAGFVKIGICGMSSGSNMALSAAARIPDLTLTIAMTPMDWVYWGTRKDRLDGAPERPAEGESAYTWRGQPLPFMPSPRNHPDYWKQIREESRRRGDMVAALDLHDLAEQKHPMTEAERIPVERIRGRLLLAGAEDDVLWNTCRAIRRMAKRIDESGSGCDLEVLTYAHCSHFIFPDTMLRLILPRFVFDLLLPLIFKETRGHVAECRRSRIDLDARIREAIDSWKASDATVIPGAGDDEAAI